jgi:hypothetical protein
LSVSVHFKTYNYQLVLGHLVVGKSPTIVFVLIVSFSLTFRDKKHEAKGHDDKWHNNNESVIFSWWETHSTLPIGLYIALQLQPSVTPSFIRV